MKIVFIMLNLIVSLYLFLANLCDNMVVCNIGSIVTGFVDGNVVVLLSSCILLMIPKTVLFSQATTPVILGK